MTSSETAQVEYSVRVVQIGDTRNVILTPRETGPFVPTAETTPEAGPGEIYVPLENLFETISGLLGTPEVQVETAHRLNPISVQPATAADSIAVGQSLHGTGSPIHDGPEQNTDQRVPNIKGISFLSNHTPLRLEPQQIPANKHKSRRRYLHPLLQLYYATILKTIRTLWKTSLVRYLRRVMVRALCLFVRVAGEPTNPAPATSMRTLLQTTIQQTIFHLTTTWFRL